MRKLQILAVLLLITVRSLFADTLLVHSYNSGPINMVPKFSKFEIGVLLPSIVQQQINLFLGGNLNNTLNPYDPERVHIIAEYRHMASGRTFHRNGFYFASKYTEGNLWKDSSTTYPIRIRFAPPLSGSYSVVVSLIVKKNLAATGQFTFAVTESKNPGNLSINKTTMKMQFEKGESFYGLGENICWADWDTDNPNFPRFQNFWETMSSPRTHDIQRGFILDLAEKGGDFARIRLDPWSVPIESINKLDWVKQPVPHNPSQLKKYLTNFHHNQSFMYEMDKTLSLCEKSGIYLMITLINNGELGASDTNWLAGGNTSWLRNPYSGLLNDNSVLGVQKFFTSDTAKAVFKKRLQYIEARWGYSPNLSIWELVNETENMSDDGSAHPPRFLWDDPKSTLKTDFCNWLCEMQDFLHSFYPPHLVTNGTTDGRIPGTNANLFLTCPLDIECKHDYTYEVDTTTNTYQSRDYNRNEFTISQFNKGVPSLFGEIGIADGNNGSVALSTKGDAWYHNSLWASLFGGGVTTNLNIMDWTASQGIHHRSNFTALRLFSSKIPFNQRLIPCTNFPEQKGHDEWPSSKVITYWLKKQNNEEVWGWTHNNSCNWMSDSYPNLTEKEKQEVLTVTRWTGEASFANYEADDKQTILKDLNARHRYKIQIYDTYDGGLLETQFERSDKNGTLSFGRKMPYLIAQPFYPDYAFVLTDLTKEYDNKGKDLVYPNPVSAELHLNLDPLRWNNPLLELYNTFGQKCAVNFSNNVIDVSALSVGIYLLRISEEGADENYKIIVVR